MILWFCLGLENVNVPRFYRNEMVPKKSPANLGLLISSKRTSRSHESDTTKLLDKQRY